VQYGLLSCSLYHFGAEVVTATKTMKRHFARILYGGSMLIRGCIEK